MTRDVVIQCLMVHLEEATLLKECEELKYMLKDKEGDLSLSLSSLPPGMSWEGQITKYCHQHISPSNFWQATEFWGFVESWKGVKFLFSINEFLSTNAEIGGVIKCSPFQSDFTNLQEKLSVVSLSPLKMHHQQLYFIHVLFFKVFMIWP